MQVFMYYTAVEFKCNTAHQIHYINISFVIVVIVYDQFIVILITIYKLHASHQVKLILV